MKKTTRKNERYSIIISSQNDARKRSHVYSISRRSIVKSICAVLLTLGLCVSVIAVSQSKVKEYSLSIAQLNVKEEQVSYVDDYRAPITHIEDDYMVPITHIEYDTPKKVTTSIIGVLAPINLDDVLPQKNDFYKFESAEIISSRPSSEKITIVREKALDEYNAPNQIVNIAMEDAMTIIDDEFKASIDKRISELVTENESTEYHIINDIDFDGDSESVNNWADVLSVYVAKTMYNDQKLLTIPSNRLDLLREIYNSMNKVNMTVVEEPVPGTKSVILSVYISINSLTYTEGAELFDLDIKQENKIEQLMSSDYYIYFNELLGVDVYDGMNNEDVQQIIQDLPDTKGAQVVKAALIRLGSPYSKSKRGSSNYVDCSYFTWWAYNQAGISIPTSSVEQARYCFDNGFVVEEKDIQPGDLVFWSKISCNCGRWNEIHHVGIYIGDGKIIDASSRNGCVVIRKLWGKDGEAWKVFMYARPE